MAEPEDMIIPMLRELRQELRETHGDLKKELGEVGTRLSGLESSMKSFRNALTADTMMSKFITGDFEERIEALEKKMDGLLKAPRA
jgi:predicted RNase H-like nuclease (RuvC/YqgF family)